jgi:hypothetical protein
LDGLTGSLLGARKQFSIRRHFCSRQKLARQSGTNTALVGENEIIMSPIEALLPFLIILCKGQKAAMCLPTQGLRGLDGHKNVPGEMLHYGSELEGPPGRAHALG